jgi:hypothetical protein
MFAKNVPPNFSSWIAWWIVITRFPDLTRILLSLPGRARSCFVFKYISECFLHILNLGTGHDSGS